MSVHVWKPRFPVDWKLLVEERIANIGIFAPFSSFDRKEECSIDITSTLRVHIFKCEVCNHESETATAFHGHKSPEHNPSIPHTSKWENNKSHICHTTFTYTTHFKSHMIEQQGFAWIVNSPGHWATTHQCHFNSYTCTARNVRISKMKTLSGMLKPFVFKCVHNHV